MHTTKVLAHFHVGSCYNWHTCDHQEIPGLSGQMVITKYQWVHEIGRFWYGRDRQLRRATMSESWQRGQTLHMVAGSTAENLFLLSARDGESTYSRSALCSCMSTHSWRTRIKHAWEAVYWQCSCVHKAICQKLLSLVYCSLKRRCRKTNFIPQLLLQKVSGLFVPLYLFCTLHTLLHKGTM